MDSRDGRNANATPLEPRPTWYRIFGWGWGLERARPGTTEPLPMQPSPELAKVADAPEAAAARVLDQVLRRPLPPYLPGEPRRLPALVEATLAAPQLLDALARIHGVRRWDWRSYKRAFVEGTLAAWRPGSIVTEKGPILRITSPVCPLAAAAGLDPRVCEQCRFALEATARLALPGQVERVGFDARITAGDPVCTMTLQRRAGAVAWS